MILPPPFFPSLRGTGGGDKGVCKISVIPHGWCCIAVNEDGLPYTDYDNCKGCMVCVEECPVKAIGRMREVMHGKTFF